MSDKIQSDLKNYALEGGYVSARDMQSLRKELGDPINLRSGNDVVEIQLIDPQHPELGRDIYAASRKLFKMKGLSLRSTIFESAGEAAARALVNQMAEFSFK